MDFETDPPHDDLAALRYPEVDGVLFDEAARCFEQAAYRAALVMTWLTIAEGCDTGSRSPPGETRSS